MASLLPAFAPWLFRQPEPHQAGHFIRATLSLAVVDVVQELVVPRRRQQTQVRMRVMVGLLLGAAVPLTCYLKGNRKLKCLTLKILICLLIFNAKSKTEKGTSKCLFLHESCKCR